MQTGKTRRQILAGTAALGASTLLGKPAIAQAWSPTKTIRIIVPFPAGATTDMLARLFAQRMTEALGQTVLVENVGGAGEERAIVTKGKVEAAWIMSVTLSTDHRAVDGALGAQMLGAFKTLIENPVMMVV